MFKKIALVSMTILFSQALLAAPIPGRAGIANPKLGVYKSPKGFEINISQSDWIQTAPPKKTRNISTMFRSPHMKNNMRGTLTVRVDELSRQTNLRSYVKRWTKQYPKFGFDVRGAKKFSMNGQVGYVVDLVSQKKKRQLRQVIFMNGKKAVLLTCRDHISTFRTTLSECNKMIKGFKWTLAANTQKNKRS